MKGMAELTITFAQVLHCKVHPSMWSARPHLSTIRRPIAAQEVAVKAVLVSHEDFCAALSGGKGLHVPYPEGVVRRVGQEVGAIRTDSHASNAVCVPSQLHAGLPSPEVPDSNFIVQPTSIYL